MERATIAYLLLVQRLVAAGVWDMSDEERAYILQESAQ